MQANRATEETVQRFSVLHRFLHLVVLIGFSVIIITLAVLTIVVVSIGGKELMKKTLASFDDKKPELKAG